MHKTTHHIINTYQQVPTSEQPVLPIAAPSWVNPGTIAENALFLAHKVAEIGLCCFEWQSSATMSEADLPPSLASLPVRWHVHLPTDLPSDNGTAAAHAALAVWERVSFLAPRVAVLHLPPFADGSGLIWLQDFTSAWTKKGLAPELLAVENVRGASPRDYGPVLWALGLSFCLDVSHALAYAHEDIWNGDAFSCQCLQRLRLSHWSAPGAPNPEGLPTDKHLALTEWTQAQKRAIVTASVLIKHLQKGQLRQKGLTSKKTASNTDKNMDNTVMIEVFDWDKILLSWPVLKELGLF